MNINSLTRAEELEHLAASERIRQSLDQVFKSQLGAPLGWLLVLALAWDRITVAPILIWIACFAPILLIILGSLHWLKTHTPPVPKALLLIAALALLDGLAWGSLFFFSLGLDRILDNWIATLVCGVAAVNAPPRAMIFRALLAQLAGIWLGVTSFALLYPATEGAWQLVAGYTVYLGLLGGYTRQVSKMMNQNILLRLQNETLAAQLQARLTTVRKEAETDPLTGQANRRSLEDALALAHDRFTRNRVNYALLMLDIDHFKMINDQYGHDVGDAALKAFAVRVAALLRPADILGRIGGEEFLVLLNDIPPEAAQSAAQRICKRTAETPLLLAPRLTVTVSIGLAYSHDGCTSAALTKQADRAVYQAKHLGRNQVQVALPGKMEIEPPVAA